VNAQGDQLDCTVSGHEPGVQQDCAVCVCVCDGCGQTWLRDSTKYSGQTWLRDSSSTCYILNSIFDILYSFSYSIFS